MTAISALHILRVGASTMLAHERAIDVTSNNMANANTTGFASSRVEFKELLKGQLEEEASGVAVSGVRHMWQQGAMRPTGRDLDLAIHGAGFLQVQLPDGRTGYTRNGALQRASDGRLHTADGYSLEPPIIIPESATDFRIDSDGSVSVRLQGEDTYGAVGQVLLATFPNEEGLEHVGRGVYVAGAACGTAANAAPGAGANGTLLSGMLEDSSVDLGEEMVNLITAQRLYTLGLKIVQTSDEMQSLANQLIGR